MFWYWRKGAGSSNGRMPERRKKVRTPMLHRSHFIPYPAVLRRTSGAMKQGVPTHVSSSESGLRTPESLKSDSFS
jgi:hypothetical protein